MQQVQGERDPSAWQHQRPCRLAGGPPVEVTQQLLPLRECAALRSGLRASLDPSPSPHCLGLLCPGPSSGPGWGRRGTWAPRAWPDGASLPPLPPCTPCILLLLTKDELEPGGCWGWSRGRQRAGVEGGRDCFRGSAKLCDVRTHGPWGQVSSFFGQGVWTALSAGFPGLPQSGASLVCDEE